MIAHIYIHIPFCLRKCDYCSFYSVSYDPDVMRKYILELRKEILHYQLKYELIPKTIYFGGGTPSLIDPDTIHSILSMFNLSHTTEITLEVNPATVTIDDLKRYSEIGVNRLSIGAQSTRSTELRLLGRLHTSTDLISLYQQGITDFYKNISVDMVYALPYQTLTKMKTTLHDLINLHPQHMSIYCLSLESDVPLFKSSPYLPTDETTAKMYHYIRNTLTDSGYTQYELSSFCSAGKVSAHNICYWTGEHYLGLGAGACGYIATPYMATKTNFRYQNNKLDEYLAGKYISYADTLTPADIEQEYIITALRLTQGLSLQKYKARFHDSFIEKYSKILTKLASKGLIEIDDTVRLTPDYYFVSNEVLCEFV